MDNECFFSIDDIITKKNAIVCGHEYNKIWDYTSDLDWYDLFRKTYKSKRSLESENRLGEVMINNEKKTYKRGYTIDEYTPWLNRGGLQSPLLGSSVSDYANRADVRRAMNIPHHI